MILFRPSLSFCSSVTFLSCRRADALSSSIICLSAAPSSPVDLKLVSRSPTLPDAALASTRALPHSSNSSTTLRSALSNFLTTSWGPEPSPNRATKMDLQVSASALTASASACDAVASASAPSALSALA